MARSPRAGTFDPSLALLVSLAAATAGCGASAASPDPAGSLADEVTTPAGAGSCVSAGDAGLAKSKWVYVDAEGKLAYKALPKGDRILDFSDAGYMGGGVAIPSVPVVKTVSPSGKDDTAAIQAALDAVAARAPKDGIRGAVLLSAGRFILDGTLSLAASGVVLRGSGSGAGGTEIEIGGAPRGVIDVGGTGSWETEGSAVEVTDAYVPSGTRTIHVRDASGLRAGDAVLVDRTVTAAWIHFMGMDALVRDGAKQTWIAAGTVIHADRAIASVDGDAVTLDAPLSDALDAAYTQVSLSRYTFAGRITQVGVESLRLVAPKQTVPIDQPTYAVLTMGAVADAWVHDVTALEFTSGITVGDTAKRVTVEDTLVSRTAPIDGSSGYPFAYSVDGQQVLVQRSAAEADDVFAFATQARSPGPNVVLDFSAKGSWTNLQPHQRWSTGLLLDGIETPGGAIDLLNRGYYGSGHGWTIGFGVVWNAVAEDIVVQQPPGAMNWSIGNAGTEETAAEPGSADTKPLPQGIVDSPGHRVAPESLYLAQLCERLGPEALAHIGD